MLRADALPARSRSHPPLQAVSPAEGQDAGLHRPRRGSLPDPDDPHARDHRDRTRGRPRTAPERGSRGGDRARTRHGPPALRARGRGGSRRRASGAVRTSLPAQRAFAADRRDAEPHRRGARRDPHAHGRARAGHPRGQGRARRRPRRLHQPRHRRRDSLRHPRGRGSSSGRGRASRCHGLEADRHARARPDRALRAGGGRGAGRRGGGCDALAPLVHVRARLPRSADAPSAQAGARGRPAGSSTGSRRKVGPRRRSSTTWRG